MIKDVHISNLRSPSKRGWNSVPRRFLRAELPRTPILWRELWPEKFGRSRSRARLTIATNRALTLVNTDSELAWLARSAINADSPRLLRRKNAMIWVFSKNQIGRAPRLNSSHLG